jgi:LPXTG-site transpeptidase (sortase) family protein
MSDEPLALPSAKQTSLPLWPRAIVRAVFGVLGLLVVLYGAADAASRLAHTTFGPAAASVAFGPAVASFVPLASSTPIVPVRLRIASIGVDAPVESVGSDQSGAMKTPSSFGATAWYDLGSKPGESGNAVIDGHVNNALTKAGVFQHLASVAVGDQIDVTDRQGSQRVFTVRDIEDYPTDAAPASVIFNRDGPPQLVLITCAGDWDPKARSYDKRLVVLASLAQ